jgi:hypothetical protein
MTETEPARLADIAAVLRDAGYELASRELAGVDAVLAETRYALVACFECDGWERLDERVFDVQSALTRVAEESPSARTWDLYLVILVLAPVRDATGRAAAEAIEADTRYARKFVRFDVAKDTLDRALRPLLPLRAPAELELSEPLGELRNELRSLLVADDVADAAVESFRRTNMVEVR